MKDGINVERITRPGRGSDFMVEFEHVSLEMNSQSLAYLYTMFISLESALNDGADDPTSPNFHGVDILLHPEPFTLEGQEFRGINYYISFESYVVNYRGVSFEVPRKQAKKMIILLQNVFPHLSQIRPIAVPRLNTEGLKKLLEPTH